MTLREIAASEVTFDNIEELPEAEENDNEESLETEAEIEA